MTCWKCGDTRTWINLHGHEVHCDECGLDPKKFIKMDPKVFINKNPFMDYCCNRCRDTGLILNIKESEGFYCDCPAGEALYEKEVGPKHFNCRCELVPPEQFSITDPIQWSTAGDRMQRSVKMLEVINGIVGKDL